MPDRSSSCYHSYLLRLWRHSLRGDWRASVQDVRTDQIHYFACAKELYAFLQAEMASQGERVIGPPEPDTVANCDSPAAQAVDPVLDSGFEK